MWFPIQVDGDYNGQPEVLSNDLTSAPTVDGQQTTRWAEEVALASQSVTNYGGSNDTWANQVC